MEDRCDFSPAALLSSRHRSRRLSKQNSRAEKQALNDSDEVYRLLKYGVQAHEVSNDTHVTANKCDLEHDRASQKSENASVFKSVCTTSVSKYSRSTVERNTVSQNSTKLLRSFENSVGNEQKTLDSRSISPQFDENSLEFEESIGFDSSYSIDCQTLYDNELHIEEEALYKDSPEIKVSASQNMATGRGSGDEVDTGVVNGLLDAPEITQLPARIHSSDKAFKSTQISGVPASSKTKVLDGDLSTVNTVLSESKTTQRDGNASANDHDLVVANNFAKCRLINGDVLKKVLLERFRAVYNNCF